MYQSKSNHNEYTTPVKIGEFNQKTWYITFLIKETKEWKNFKVFSLDKKKPKSNFWLSHNNNRIACGKDYKILEEHYLELKETILRYLFDK
jgi:hypothetical protein